MEIDSRAYVGIATSELDTRGQIAHCIRLAVLVVDLVVDQVVVEATRHAIIVTQRAIWGRMVGRIILRILRIGIRRRLKQLEQALK